MTAADSGAHLQLVGRDPGTFGCGHLSPVLPHKHEAQSSRPGGSSGVDRGQRSSGEGGSCWQKWGDRDIKGEGVDGDALHVSPTRVGVPVSPSLRTGIWLRCAKIKKKTEPSARRFPRGLAGPDQETAPGPRPS